MFKYYNAMQEKFATLDNLSQDPHELENHYQKFRESLITEFTKIDNVSESERYLYYQGIQRLAADLAEMSIKLYSIKHSQFGVPAGNSRPAET